MHTEDRTPAELSHLLFLENPLPLLLCDAQSWYYLDVNSAALQLYGYSINEWRSMTVFDLRPPSDRERLRRWLENREAASATGFRETGMWRHVRRDGSLLEVEGAWSRAFPYQGRTVHLIAVSDVTERNRATALNRANGVLLETLDGLEGLGSFHLDLRTGRYRLSRLWTEALGRDDVALSDTRDVLAPLIPFEHHSAIERFVQAIETRRSFQEQYQIRSGGELRWLETRMRVVTDEHGTATDAVGITTDVSEGRNYTERLYQVAYRDAQTGLPNRAALNERRDVPPVCGAVLLFHPHWVASAAQRSPALRTAAALALVDILRRALPEDAAIIRYTEEAFALVLPPRVRERSLLPLARRMLASFARPLRVAGDELVIIPSIGLAPAGAEPRDVGELCREAECALDSAMGAQERIALYDQRLAAAHERRAVIERYLRHAVADRRISAVYQPIVSLETGRIVAAEALMRWDCPQIGPVPAAEFIAIAEESDVILKLGEWMLREACAQLRRWHLAGFGRLRMSVNVAARQVQQRDFVRLVASVCQLTSVPTSALEMELTEGTMMHQDSLAMRNLEALRRRGVRVSVDDFGTGYSSLSYLKNLPLDTLKIDRSFVAPIADDSFQREVARSAVSLAHKRGLNVVGEGVETVEQVSVLRALLCDEVQGYLFGQPMPGTDLERLLQRERRGESIMLAGRSALEQSALPA